MVVEIEYDIADISSIIAGNLVEKRQLPDIRFLALDSRKITIPQQTLFWALDSKGRKGSDFIREAYHAGVRAFVTQDEINVADVPEAAIIYVPNALEALQKLAAYHRNQFEKPDIIAIAGSNGKTIVKEWLANILSRYYNVIKNPASYNSQIGVALSLLQIREEHEIGIFEAGISLPNEMTALQKMIRPNYGVLTNIGSAHDEGFESREEKVREKLKLFTQIQKMIYPFEEREMISAAMNDLKETGVTKSDFMVSWGEWKSEAACQYSVTGMHDGKTHIKLHWRNDPSVEVDEIEIPFTDQASIKNAVTVYTALRSFGYFRKEMIPLFASLPKVKMRLEVKPGIRNCSVIDDSYSNDLQSLEIAIDFLKQQNKHKRTIILSDFEESGMSRKDRYLKIADIITRNKINRLIGVGFAPHYRKMSLENIPNSLFFENTEELLDWIRYDEFANEAILVKGARHFRFEMIIHRLEIHIHQTVLSVNLTNLAHNIRVYKSMLKPGTKLMAMVKAFAYGTGSMQISSLLEYIKADYLTVAFTEEGVDLRHAGIRLPIMVMNVLYESFDYIVENELEPEIYSFKMLQDFSSFLRSKERDNYPIHLKFDTGMHRLGFGEEDTERVIEEIKRERSVKIASVFSHLSASGNPEQDDFTKLQFAKLLAVKTKIEAAFPYKILFHIANSGAISRFPDMHLDMVRLGIGMYGIDGNKEVAKFLKPVNRLTTIIAQLRAVKAGDVVGYNARRIPSNQLIATVGIGYADGYPRRLGNGVGKMMVNGVLAATVGDVCMDMTMIDVTNVTGVKEGDEVVVFSEELPIEQVALAAETIPYEILTGISPRVRRVYYEES